MAGFTKKQIDLKVSKSKTPFLNKSQIAFAREALKSGNYPGSPGSTKSEIKSALEKIARNPNDSINKVQADRIKKIFGI